MNGGQLQYFLLVGTVVYTVDFEGTPVVRERMHWVVCEAIGAAASLHRAQEALAEVELMQPPTEVA